MISARINTITGTIQFDQVDLSSPTREQVACLQFSTAKNPSDIIALGAKISTLIDEHLQGSGSDTLCRGGKIHEDQRK